MKISKNIIRHLIRELINESQVQFSNSRDSDYQADGWNRERYALMNLPSYFHSNRYFHFVNVSNKKEKKYPVIVNLREDLFLHGLESHVLKHAVELDRALVENTMLSIKSAIMESFTSGQIEVYEIDKINNTPIKINSASQIMTNMTVGDLINTLDAINDRNLKNEKINSFENIVWGIFQSKLVSYYDGLLSNILKNAVDVGNYNRKQGQEFFTLGAAKNTLKQNKIKYIKFKALYSNASDFARNETTYFYDIEKTLLLIVYDQSMSTATREAGIKSLYRIKLTDENLCSISSGLGYLARHDGFFFNPSGNYTNFAGALEEYKAAPM